MLRVGVYVHPRGQAPRTCTAIAHGIRSVGDAATVHDDTDYQGPIYDAAVFWGFWQTLQDIAHGYAMAGKPWIFIDMGYWGRDKSDPIYKLTVNNRHPTAYFRARLHDDRRARHLGLNLKPWRRRGSKVLVLGMSGKAAWAAGLPGDSKWERDVIADLRSITDRPIVYRPKPSWADAKPLPGSEFCPGSIPLAAALADCWATVSHHSNASCDSIVAGVPTFVWEGAAMPMASADPHLIETPRLPEDRAEWINDLSYCQWSITELADGTAWRHLKAEGLIP